MNNAETFGQLGLDDPATPGGWDNRSIVVLLASTCLYWVSIWLASGLPPLASIASRLHDGDSPR
jgi:hypothetical protein